MDVPAPTSPVAPPSIGQPAARGIDVNQFAATSHPRPMLDDTSRSYLEGHGFSRGEIDAMAARFGGDYIQRLVENLPDGVSKGVLSLVLQPVHRPLHTSIRLPNRRSEEMFMPGWLDVKEWTVPTRDRALRRLMSTSQTIYELRNEPSLRRADYEPLLQRIHLRLASLERFVDDTMAEPAAAEAMKRIAGARAKLQRFHPTLRRFVTLSGTQTWPYADVDESHARQFDRYLTSPGTANRFYRALATEGFLEDVEALETAGLLNDATVKALLQVKPEITSDDIILQAPLLRVLFHGREPVTIPIGKTSAETLEALTRRHASQQTLDIPQWLEAGLQTEKGIKEAQRRELTLERVHPYRHVFGRYPFVERQILALIAVGYSPQDVELAAPHLPRRQSTIALESVAREVSAERLPEILIQGSVGAVATLFNEEARERQAASLPPAIAAAMQAFSEEQHFELALRGGSVLAATLVADGVSPSQSVALAPLYRGYKNRRAYETAGLWALMNVSPELLETRYGEWADEYVGHGLASHAQEHGMPPHLQAIADSLRIDGLHEYSLASLRGLLEPPVNADLTLVMDSPEDEIASGMAHHVNLRPGKVLPLGRVEEHNALERLRSARQSLDISGPIQRIVTTAPQVVGTLVEHGEVERDAIVVGLHRFSTPSVPEDPESPRAHLRYAIHHASNAVRDGVIAVHFGGPGSSASAKLANYIQMLRKTAPELVERFDIVGLDELGVGDSNPLMGNSISGHDSERLELLGTRTAAAHLDALRAHLGAEQLHIIGYSYGASLATVYALQHPQNAGKIIADSLGAVPGLPVDRHAPDEVKHEVREAFLDWCEEEGCEFAADEPPREVYERLADRRTWDTRVAANPRPSSWKKLDAYLANPKDLRGQPNPFASRYPVGYLVATRCNDGGATVDCGNIQVDSPILPPGTGAPILVIQATHDTLTPLRGAKKTVAELERMAPGTGLLEVQGVEHGVSLQAEFPAVNKAVTDYLTGRASLDDIVR